MSCGSAWGIGLVGMEGHIVNVEVSLTDGIPGLTLVGMPDRAVREAQDRVKSALAACKVMWPDRRVVINLSPASVPKVGSGYDLAIALAVMAACGKVDRQSTHNCVHIAELGLDGRTHPVRGVLPAVKAAVERGAGCVVVAQQSLSEASLVPGIKVIGVQHLAQAIAVHGGKADMPKLTHVPQTVGPLAEPSEAMCGDLSEVRGQGVPRRALEVAAAGAHHLLMIGSPGAGKTMLASRMPSILPALNTEDAIEVTALRSLAGLFEAHQGLITRSPFEAPHHSATLPAIVGGGTGIPMPGSASLAHKGVLFLDEAPEFGTRVLDALRQPLESGVVVLRRAAGHATYPARFQLVMAANPCPCGFAGSRKVECTCTPWQRVRYLERLSGPLLDRIDIQIHVDTPTMKALGASEEPESSTVVAARVVAARAAQAKRWGPHGWLTNSEVPGPFLRRPESGLDPVLLGHIDAAVDKGTLTMRGADRVLRLAWSIADLAGDVSPKLTHLGEAMSLRTQTGRRQ
ncbi:MAG: YifB family Mg chelatase-like AAA ATPase [Actinomycetaceae bacterium]|nr:YifB family Mg chelatase-like AAA ATPase [Actinomycetaceae bacterium]